MSKEKQDGDCFVVAANIISCWDMIVLADEAAASAIKQLKLLGISNDELWLCHGVVTRPTDGKQHVHAWIEIQGKRLVLDFANGMRAMVPVATYYEIGKIDEQLVERYNATASRRKLVNYEHYGPWANHLKGFNDE